jgi:hypothetical protein
MSEEKKSFENEASKSNQIAPGNYGSQSPGPYDQQLPPPSYGNQQQFGGGMPPYAQQPQHHTMAPYGQQVPYGQPPFGQAPFNQQGPLFNQQQPPFYQQQPYYGPGAFDQQNFNPPFNNQGPPGQQYPPFGGFDQQQVPQAFINQGPGQPLSYGQYPPSEPQMQGYPYGQFPPPDPGQIQPGAPEAANGAPVPELFKVTEEQLIEYRNNIRKKFRHTMPFDWLGQADNQWYSSWCMKQQNFFAFRLGLVLYAYWAWAKFHGQLDGNTWTGKFEFFADSSSIIRAGVTWFSLFSVFLGIFGVTILSGLQLILSEKSFSTLSSYRLHSTRLGKILNWAVFGMNFHYDAAPITACMALVLTITPNNFYQIKLAQPLWPALTLPLLILMDLWLVKRCRIDMSYIRRNMILMISFVAFCALVWAYYFYFFIQGIFKIYTTKSFASEIAPILFLVLAFVIVAAVGTDSVYNFLRFKSHYLISNHFDKISARDVKKILGDNEERYHLKMEKIRLELEAEQAKYFAELSAQFDQNQYDNNAAGTSAGTTDPVAEVQQ